MSKLWLTALAVAGLQAETHSLTLRQVVELAAKQNPDIALLRLEELKASQAVRVAKDPFTPRITVGSGLAYSSGFPMSIEGAAPSIVQARATQYLYNRPQSYAVAQAKEQARSAGIAVSVKQDEIAFQAASLFLDAERLARIAPFSRKQLESLEKVAQAVQARVEEGRELRLASKRAALNLARVRQILQVLDADLQSAEASLAVLLGFSADDRVHPSEESRKAPEVPMSEDMAVERAINSSKELKRLESQVIGKRLEIRGERAARLPHIDLVAQYAVFARFNNYEDFFRRFQRHNGQLGISFQLPVLPGSGVSAAVAQTEMEIGRLRIEVNALRNRIALDVRQGFRQIRKEEAAQEVARRDLDAAREQLSLNLALMDEGRLLLKDVEEARFAESEKWIAFYDAQYALDRSRWSLLRYTGELLSALR